MTIFLVLIWLHFFADFVCQSDKMAVNKSTDSWQLFLHVLVYSMFFIWWGPIFFWVTFYAHMATDYVTSRVTARLYKAGHRHWFFVVIGFDQALHMSQLVLTYYLTQGM